MRRGTTFTRLDSVSDGFLRRSAKGDSALLWLRTRWDRIVGEPLSRKVTPRTLEGNRLTIDLLDPLWRKPVLATIPELERKLAAEMPQIRPKVILREPAES